MNLTLTIVHKTKKMNNLLQIQGNVCSLPDCHYHLSLSPFLKMGVAKAFFQSSGTWWDDRDYLLPRREIPEDYERTTIRPCMALVCV